MNMESEHVKATIEHVRNCPEAMHEDSKMLPESKTRDLSSASSVSSSSSSHSSLEFDEKSHSDDSAAESKCDRDLLCSQESISTPDYIVQTPAWSMISLSPAIGIEDHLLQMTSPPIQTMDQASYDPNRIPSSVFATKAANALDWSITSNESLFSIHMGNNSLSRESLLWKSGELSRLDELNNSQSLCGSEGKYSEWSSPSSLPPVIEVSAHEESSAKSSNASRADNELGSNKSLKVAPEATKTTLTSSSTHRLSDESGHSSSSFAFPVLVSDGGKTGSLEGVEEKPEESELQSEDSSKETQRSSIGRWFSWFSCLPRCC